MRLIRLPEPTQIKDQDTKKYIYDLLRVLRLNDERQIDGVDLADTGVTAGTYGAADTVGVFIVEADGRLTSATNVPIEIVSTQVSDFDDAAINAAGHLSAVYFIALGDVKTIPIYHQMVVNGGSLIIDGDLIIDGQLYLEA